jgi:rRNA methylase
VFENVRIILVEPQHPGNIGAGARAMKNMGFNDLWLVNPKRFPDPQADWRAAGATDLLEYTRVCSTLNKAIADCQLVIGTSARVRNIPRPSIFAKELPGLISSHPADLKVAILFW